MPARIGHLADVADHARRERRRLRDNVSSVYPHTRSTAFEESTVTATYTFDAVSTLDGYGSYNEHGDWGGFWGRGPSSSTAGSPCTTRSSGWSSGPTRFGSSCRCWARAPRCPSST